MFFVLAAMVFILVVASLVVVYAAYPNRGEQVPHAAWLGDAMIRAKDHFSVLDEERDRTVVRR